MHAQLVCNAGASRAVQRRTGLALDPSTQPPKVEEQRLLRRGRTRAYDRAVPQDVILHGRANPPSRISGETDAALRRETSRSLQKPDISFLQQIAAGQSVISEARCHARLQP